MRITGSLPGVIALTVLGTTGCFRSAVDDGVSNKLNNQLSEASDLAQSVNGNYSQLTPEQKQKILRLVNNDPKQAELMVQRMAHAPAPPKAPR